LSDARLLMNDIALQLTLPQDTFRALQDRAEAHHLTVPQFLVEIAKDYLEREARLAAGRAMLRALPHRAPASNAPRDLAAKHDDYLTRPA